MRTVSTSLADTANRNWALRSRQRSYSIQYRRHQQLSIVAVFAVVYTMGCCHLINDYRWEWLPYVNNTHISSTLLLVALLVFVCLLAPLVGTYKLIRVIQTRALTFKRINIKYVLCVRVICLFSIVWSIYIKSYICILLHCLPHIMRLFSNSLVNKSFKNMSDDAGQMNLTQYIYLQVLEQYHLTS